MELTGIGIQIGPILLPYYGLMIVIGMAAGCLVAWLQCKKWNIPFDEFVLTACLGGVMGLLGAKIMYLLVNVSSIDWQQVFSSFQAFREWIGSGFLFYGGVIGGVIGLILCRCAFKVDVFSVLRVTIPALPIAHGFGRIGCSLVGCCHGVAYEGFCALTYHESMFAPNGVSLFPVQPLESLCLFVIAGIVTLSINRPWSNCTSLSGSVAQDESVSTRDAKREESENHVCIPGAHGISLYLGLYGAARFILEFWRGDEAAGFFLHLSSAQWMSILLICAAVAIFFWERAHLAHLQARTQESA